MSFFGRVFTTERMADAFFGGVLFLIIQYLLRLPRLLLENAMMGGIDDWIAATFGLTWAKTFSFVSEWGISLGAAALVLWACHWVWHRRWERTAQKDRFVLYATATVTGPNPALRRKKLLTAGIVFAVFVIGTFASGAWLIRTYQNTASLKADVASASIKTRPYDQREIEDLKFALRDANDFVQTKLSPMHDAIKQFTDSWETRIARDGTNESIALLTGLRERMQTVIWPELNDLLYRKHNLYIVQMQTALNTTKVSPPGMTPAIDAAIAGVRGLPENPELLTIRLLNIQFDQLRKDTEAFGSWIAGADEHIKTMTENLRKNGTTGYEQIEK